MSLRLLSLIFVRICGWLVLPGRSPACKNAGLLVLRHEVAGPRRGTARPRLDRAGRAGRAALIRLLPGGCDGTGWSLPAPCCGGTAARSPGSGAARTGPDGRRPAPRPPR